MRNRYLLVFFFILFFIPALTRSQTVGDYRTVGTGNWASPATWETYTGSVWVPAATPPTSLSGNINIRNTHTVTVSANRTVDQLTIDAGGTLVLGSNTLSLDASGSGNLNCDGILHLNGGNLNFNLTNTITVDGTMLWSDGDLIGGTVTIANGGTLTLNTPAPKDLQSATIHVNLGGTMNWNDGNINVNPSGGINNNGTINTACNNSVAGFGTFNNNSGGVFRKTSTGTTTFNVPVTNTLGTFKGLGTYDFNNLFLNAGTFSPGLSPGIVIVTYADPDPLNYPLLGTNSELDIEIMDGSGPGTGHDQIVKDNSITLSGTLRVTETGTVPDGSYAIVIVTSGSISGDFSSVILPPGYTLTITASIVIVTKSTGILPVKLANFTARKVDNAVQLDWQTFSESNSDRFEIERSRPGEAFVKIGQVNAAGISNQPLTYQFRDDDPGKGLNLYRLKQVDKDNRFEYSDTRWIKIDDTKDQLFVFPTITNGVVSVLTNKKTIIELYTMQGARLLRKEVSNNEELDLSNYPNGVYVLRNQNDRRSYKIVKR
ncbi:MAG TPA: T9SS type A sorting domain-containing protein [Chitinophagaceae bacterium]|nr:T9SS type A sorting domain-containing protein [Chitinophagaceae bacterium]